MHFTRNPSLHSDHAIVHSDQILPMGICQTTVCLMQHQVDDVEW